MQRTRVLGPSAGWRDQATWIGLVVLVTLLFVGRGIADQRLWRDSIRWIATERVRGAYSPYDPAHYQHLGEAGFNAVMTAFPMPVGPPSARNIAAVREAAVAAQKAGLRFFPGIYWYGAEADFARTRPWHAVTRQGIELEDVPCPSDQGFWDAVLTERMEGLARLSREVPLAGLLVDFEAYYGQSKYSGQVPGQMTVRGAGWIGRDTCFCDHCFYGFLRSKRLPRLELAPSEREPWLYEHGYITAKADEDRAIGDYFDFLRAEWGAFARDTERVVHAVNPDLLLGGYPGMEGSVLRAWGREDLPVAVFTEAGYDGGYWYKSVDNYQVVRRQTANLIFVNGVIHGLFAPLALVPHLTASAENFDGYWLYTTINLETDWRLLRRGVERGAWTKAPAEDYWQVFKRINATVAAMSPERPKRVAPPLPEYWAAPPERVEPSALASRPSLWAPPVELGTGRYEQWFRVLLGPDDLVEFTLRLESDDVFGCAIGVYGPDGEMMDFALARPAETTAYARQAPAGSYVVVLNSLTNRATLNPGRGLWARDASRATHLFVDGHLAFPFTVLTSSGVSLEYTADPAVEITLEGDSGRSQAKGGSGRLEIAPPSLGSTCSLALEGRGWAEIRMVSPRECLLGGTEHLVPAQLSQRQREGLLSVPRELWRFRVDGEVYAPPTLVDLEGDGRAEILTTSRDAVLRCLAPDGRLLWATDLPDVVEAPPALGDVDGDGRLDIVCADRGRTIQCLSHSGEPKWARNVGGEIMWSSPALCDLTGDGLPEIIVGGEDGHLYCLSSAGEIQWVFRGGDSFACTVGAGSLVDGGAPVVIAPCSDARIYCLDASGRPLWEFRTGDTNYSSPLLLDIDGDGKREILLGSGDANLYCLNADGSLRWKAAGGDAFDSTLALADIDGDGRDDLAALDHAGGVFALTLAGQQLWSADVGMKIDAAPSIADVDGDGKLEILVPTRDAYLVCLDSSGREKWRWAYGVPDGQPGSCAVGDPDQDGYLEIFFGTKAREIICLTLNAPAKPASVPWAGPRPPLTRTGGIGPP